MNLYIFDIINEYEFIYFYLTDKDKINSNEKLDGVDKLILKYCSSFTGKIEKVFAIKEIETWFLAGLGKEFIENYSEVNEGELEKFYKEKDLESIDDTKEILKNIILKNTKIGTSQGYIGREFGKYIDIEQAKNKSNSFRKFIDILDNLFL